MTGNASHPKCPSCAAAEPRRIGSLPRAQQFAGGDVDGALPGGSLYGCLSCGLKFRYPVLAAAQYDALYDNDSPSAWQDGPCGRQDWSLITEYVAQHAGAGASVLDFGCDTGGLLDRLGSHRPRFGVEINARARKAAAERTGARVVATLDSLPPGRKFDVVTAVDVIEHFSDPGRTLESLLDMTSESGMLIVTTGDADALLWRLTGSRWWYCFFPEHLAFISERWVRAWLLRADRNAALVVSDRFRYVRLSAPRYALQACLALLYFVAPQGYIGLVGRIRRMLGRGPAVQAPGVGLSKDHLFLVIRKSRLPG